MQINDILTERKIQRVQTMYHGTSSTLVPSILKHGLLANPPKSTYSRETNVDSGGYDTFKGGVYLTSDLDKAEEGADNASTAHGGDPVLITLQYVISSGTIDEDDIMAILTESILDSTPAAIETVEDASAYYSNKQNFQNALTQVEQAFLNPTKINLGQYNARPTKIKLNRNALLEIRVLATVFLRHIINKKQSSSKFRNYVSFRILNDIRHTPAFETAMYNVLATVKPIESDTVRVTRNIGFKGKTRIIRIENRSNGKVYYDQTTMNRPKENVGPIPQTKAEWYFFGNPSEDYAWGTGQTPEAALADGKQGFDDWQAGDPNPEYTWENELEVCKVYPTDERTHELIQADGLRKFVRKGNLIVADKSER